MRKIKSQLGYLAFDGDDPNLVEDFMSGVMKMGKELGLEVVQVWDEDDVRVAMESAQPVGS